MEKILEVNRKTISDIVNDFVTGKLVIDSSYQRKHVWLEQDNVRLIETILLDFVIPEVFFWPMSIDSDTGKMITHIVDGQQRILAIVDFIQGKYNLSKKSLTSEEIRDAYGEKYFSDFSSEDKDKIWKYRLSIIEIGSGFKRNDVIRMFNRLNMTNYNLNSQEKRHGKPNLSCFGEASEALASSSFWDKVHLFSPNDVRRMKDVEYCCSIYILANEGVFDQTNDETINHYYDDYSDLFDEDGNLIAKIKRAMGYIEKFYNKESKSFISKKAQMFTLFSFVFNLIDNDINCTKEIINRVNLFIKAYNAFKNEYDISFDNSEIQKLNEDIKKYKLASSEGINKLKNRMIRFEVLYKLCTNDSQQLDEELQQLLELYKREITTHIDKDDIENKN
ncbi:MAG: DUF262 domain-containing protein [Spirochaetaceae bacterium]|jgi:hypothetical protein|nr:DUF262 domain-containing protein [Spirochaetaceae bacterium]